MSIFVYLGIYTYILYSYMEPRHQEGKIHPSSFWGPYGRLPTCKVPTCNKACHFDCYQRISEIARPVEAASVN